MKVMHLSDLHLGKLFFSIIYFVNFEYDVFRYDLFLSIFHLRFLIGLSYFVFVIIKKIRDKKNR